MYWNKEQSTLCRQQISKRICTKAFMPQTQSEKNLKNFVLVHILKARLRSLYFYSKMFYVQKSKIRSLETTLVLFCSRIFANVLRVADHFHHAEAERHRLCESPRSWDTSTII